MRSVVGAPRLPARGAPLLPCASTEGTRAKERSSTNPKAAQETKKDTEVGVASARRARRLRRFEEEVLAFALTSVLGESISA